jgi:hypothetical protein
MKSGARHGAIRPGLGNTREKKPINVNGLYYKVHESDPT